MRSKEKLLDEYLAASAQLGDHKALAILVERWNPRLLAHAWRLLGDKEAAKDAVQEGWAEIIKNLSKLNDVRAFPAWSYRIVSRRCARAINDAKRHRHSDTASIVEMAADEDEREATSDLDKLRKAIRALPPEQRVAVALFHFEEMGIAETAVALDVPAGTVKTRLMHARRKLRATLQGE